MERTGGERVQAFLGTFEIRRVFGRTGTTQTIFLAATATKYAYEGAPMNAAAIRKHITLAPSMPLLMPKDLDFGVGMMTDQGMRRSQVDVKRLVA